jgi:hypothetical protein
MTRPWHICTDPTDVTRDAVLDVRFQITSYGCEADATDPGSPPEVQLTSAVDESGAERLHGLTTEQQDAIEAEIAADFDFRRHALDERGVGL